ncbi:MAG: hypothetical protein CVT70_19805 [Alphaproteobacteria bacterium HGW-Alphaproteobacteria-1]|jgi:crotonobetainyl-CoA:carnitine CoA-transferase CaiB-like acyl-CoA transferase|nr:MAG: hypothetical protein CVT70_19805 [Alphaproteobacteria bacterium HGW-Alphaproteobacteria-1]
MFILRSSLAWFYEETFRWGQEVASNPIAEAATGVMYSNRIDGRPSRLGPSYHDQFADCYAVIAVLSALLNRSDPAKRDIELGLYETGLHIAARDLLGVQLKSHLLGRPEQEPSAEFSIPGYGSYETSDGRWIYLVMLTDDHWRKFCAATAIESNPDHATLRQRRRARPEIEALVADRVRAYSYDDLARTLADKGVGHTEVLSLDRVLDVPQAQAPGKCSDFTFKDYDFHTPDLPLPNLTRSEDMSKAPPLLGEDTRSILNMLGYDEAAITALLDAGAARSADSDAALWALPEKTA